MKNKFSKVFFVIVALLAVCLLAVACNPDEQNPPDPVKYTVTYVGGTGTTGTAPTGGEYAESAKFNLPDAGTLAKPDHTFGGWSYGGTTYATGAEFTMPKNDVEFTAVWVVKNQLVQYDKTFVATLVLDKDSNNGFIEISNDVIGAQPTTVNFTYTLSGTALAITLANNGGTFNGTLENNVITITITYNSKAYEFKASDPTPTDAPTVTFDANGGTGTAPAAPTITKIDNGYSFKIPANTYTAPAEKEFDKWQIIVKGKDTQQPDYRPANQTYIAKAGEEITLKAIWKDIEVIPISGVTYVGSCTVPQKTIVGGMTGGGQTYTKFVIDTESDPKTVHYLYEGISDLVASNYVKVDTLPAAQGETPTPCLEVKLADEIAYYIVINLNNTITLYNTSGDLLTNGTFTKDTGSIDPQPTTYTVTFDPNNGGDTWKVTVNANGKVEKPATDPTISGGKLFRYWTDTDGYEYDFDSTNVTANITLYAKYDYKASFNAGGATGTVPADIWVKGGFLGSKFPNAGNLTKDDAVFDGWTDGETKYSAGESIPQATATYTAVWRTTFNVKFSAGNGGQGTSPATITEQQPGATITLPANPYTVKSSYTGFSFSGWLVDGNLKQPGETFAMPKKDLTVIAQWTAGTFNVTYKPGDHGTGDAVTIPTPAKANGIELSSVPTGFTIENQYILYGWTVEGDDSGDIYGGSDAKYPLGADVTFVAQYLHMYGGEDNEGNIYIQLDFDTNTGFIMNYYTEVETALTISTDGENITITPDGGTACTGTFINNQLNIVLTVGGTDYAFGTVTPDPDPDDPSEFVSFVTEATKNSDFMGLGSNTTNMYFAESFENGGTTFVGLQFNYNSNLGVRVKAIYLDADGVTEKLPSSNLTIQQIDNNLLVYSNSTYDIRIGKKADGKYYVTSFKYKSATTPDTTERVLLTEKP